MKLLRDRIALFVAGISLLASGMLWLTKPESPVGLQASVGASELAASRRALTEMRTSLGRLTTELDDLRHAIGTVQSQPDGSGDALGTETTEGTEVGETTAFVSIDQRLSNLEMSLAKLRSNYEGISIEGASEERARIFASPQGALKADEYFEAGKYSIAAEGYLTYLRHNPEDPDDRSIMGRARNSYQRAGYSDMAIWVQEQMMENFPESRVNDLQQLAAMEKEAGLLDDAISHAAESAELDNNTQSKMWTRLYWAWYHQLRDGPAAGLDAYRQVQQEIISAGFDDHRLNERASEKIAEIKKELAAAR